MNLEGYEHYWRLHPADLLELYESTWVKIGGLEKRAVIRQVILNKLKREDMKANIAHIGQGNVWYGGTPQEIHPLERSILRQEIDDITAFSLYSALTYGDDFERTGGDIFEIQLDMFMDYYRPEEYRVNRLIRKIAKISEEELRDGIKFPAEAGFALLHRLTWVPCRTPSSSHKNVSLFKGSPTPKPKEQVPQNKLL